MNSPAPIVLVPGLNCSARIYSNQIARLWPFGTVTIANHTHGDEIASIARQILAAAPVRFALAGYSLGGYVAFEMLRQAPERIVKLALLATSARPDSPEQTAVRRERIALAEAGQFDAILDRHFPVLVHSTRRDDQTLYRLYVQMARENGAEIFVRHQRAIIRRADSRPDLAAIRCPTLVLVGDSDQVTPPDAAREMATGIAGSRLVVVPACGHLVPLEQPAVVSEALVQWIEQ